MRPAVNVKCGQVRGAIPESRPTTGRVDRLIVNVAPTLNFPYSPEKLNDNAKGCSMMDEKVFEDAVRLATLWLEKTKVTTPQAYRDQVEQSVQAIYMGLRAVRDRIETELL